MLKTRWSRNQIALTAVLGIIVLATAAARLVIAHHTSRRNVARLIATTLGLPSDSVVRIAKVDFRPFSRSFHVTTLTITTEKWDLRIASAILTGIHLGPLLRSSPIVATATIDGVRLNVRRDARDSERAAEVQRSFPHDVFRRLTRIMRVDTVRVSNGVIRYMETARDGARPGTMVFSRFHATAYNVTNHPALMADSTPAVIDVQLRLAGRGHAVARATYNLLSPDLTLSYSGSVGSMPGSAFNALLVDLEGIRVTSGILDSAWFDVTIRDDRATGSLTMLYHDLGIDMMNKVTHDRSLGDRLASFIGANFTLNGSNPVRRADGPTTVRLARTRSAHVSLIRFVWETLREGMKTTIGI